jgi:hypothetical protein
MLGFLFHLGAAHVLYSTVQYFLRRWYAERRDILSLGATPALLFIGCAYPPCAAYAPLGQKRAQLHMYSTTMDCSVSILCVCFLYSSTNRSAVQ